MNTIITESFAMNPLVTSTGWTLVHFVWQAILVAFVVALGLGLMRRSSAHHRYLFALGGFAVMSIAPIATFFWLLSTASTDDLRINRQTTAVDNSAILFQDSGRSSTEVSDPVTRPVDAANQTERLAENQAASIEFAQSPRAEQPVGWSERLDAVFVALRQWLHWCVAVWIVGVMCLAIRLLAGMRRVWKWRNEGVEVGKGELTEAVSRLCSRMQLRQPVRLLESARDAVPAVVGWIRPAILVPASMASGLTVTELDSILAHELAHIRRHDYLVNLVQTVVETLLFYHPAVWWLSSRIRAERENCCDDIAITVCGNRVAFAQALARMEEIRCRGERFAVAAGGGSLVQRIRRIVGTENAVSGMSWPAGVAAVATLGLLIGGLWVTSVSASATSAGSGAEHLSNPSITESENPADDEYKTLKSESKLTDSKTGMEQRVFKGIELTSVFINKTSVAKTDMKYSNLFGYSFIPARTAKELNAIELGEIDFGEGPPSVAQPFQAMFVPELDDPAMVRLRTAQTHPEKSLEVHEVLSAVEKGVTVVPYGHDAVWIPGHLEFYGMNQTKQHVFKIVRIEKVDLGVGPSFGPVNALVLDDANSDFGLLGNNWTQQVRGENGEGLWFEAATGSFHFMATPEHLKQYEPQSAAKTEPPQEDLGRITVESSGHKETPNRQDREGVKVLASHTYPENYRESTGWVTVDGVQLPIDVGVDHDGVTVYKTLMYDIVAVETESKKVLWKKDWGKTMPMWKTVSIVELDGDDGMQKAVELFAANGKTRELVYEYFNLRSGEKLQSPTGTTTNDKNRNDQVPKIRIVESSGEQMKRAAIDAPKDGRSAQELVRHFASWGRGGDRFRQGSSITNMETIVSAVRPNYVFPLAVSETSQNVLQQASEAAEVLFNLPEGSGLRAEFSGKKIEISNRENGVSIIVTHGRLELIDAGGVIRAWASPDGGAEQLVIDAAISNGEVVMSMKTRRIEPFPDYPNPPVQFVMNANTGAPADEKDPPHGGIRYDFQQGEDDGQAIMRMKMKWRYDMNRLLEEAMAETGLTEEELIFGKPNEEATDKEPPPHPTTQVPYPLGMPPIQPPALSQKLINEMITNVQPRIPSVWIPTPEIDPDILREFSNRTSQLQLENAIREHIRAQQKSNVDANQPSTPDGGNANEGHSPDDTDGWGDLAERSGLRSRLTLQTENPTVGQPLLFKLEVKNFGDRPTTIDQQNYFPYRVLRAESADGKAATFVGMTPQTSQEEKTLQPGESILLWENVDAGAMFILNEGPHSFFAEGGEWATQTLWRDSNRVSTDIAPGQQTPLIRLLVELGKDLPDKWKVANGMDSSYGWKGVFLSHPPTAMGRRPSGVQIWFTDEPLPEDYELGKGENRQTVTQMGRSELGFVNVAAQPYTLELWPGYLDHVREATSKVFEFENKNEEAPNELPWQVSGTVTDSDGKPLEGVTVNAHAGMGSLFNTGSGVTDKHGRYHFRFGPGIHGGDPKMVQAATISVSLDGFTEKNLHRQGDCVAALEQPDEIGWGGKTEEQLFLPNKPMEINFVMVPATFIGGRVWQNDAGKPAADYSVSLTGPELPPSSSVIDQVKVGDDGSFRIDNVPVGFPFQILVEPAKRGSPWNGWASPPMVFVRGDSGNTHIEYIHNGKPVDFSFQSMYVFLNGEGVNWKAALANAAAQPLLLKWDGLSTETMIAASEAHLELGAKE